MSASALFSRITDGRWRSAASFSFTSPRATASASSTPAKALVIEPISNTVSASGAARPAGVNAVPNPNTSVLTAGQHAHHQSGGGAGPSGWGATAARPGGGGEVRHQEGDGEHGVSGDRPA